jgi:hypothetical protein
MDALAHKLTAVFKQIIVPLSNFSVVGMRRESSREFIKRNNARDDVIINVLVVKLNINLNAQSLEEMRYHDNCRIRYHEDLVFKTHPLSPPSTRASRQKVCLGLVEEMALEVIQCMSGSDVISPDKIHAECTRIKNKILNPEDAARLELDSADYFNDANR